MKLPNQPEEEAQKDDLYILATSYKGKYQKASKQDYDPMNKKIPIKSKPVEIPRRPIHPRQGLENLLGKTKMMPRQGIQTSDYRDHMLVKSSYENFKTTQVGQDLLKKVGDTKVDGYGMLDLGEGAIAATIYQSDGKKFLAWNSRYKHMLENPQANESHLKTYLEAMAHEHIHLTGDKSETSTYTRTADFYKGQAKQSPNSLYGQLYESIAKDSYHKAGIFGEGGPGYASSGSGKSLGDLIGSRSGPGYSQPGSMSGHSLPGALSSAPPSYAGAPSYN
mgnify:CR=1 FL=1